MVNNAVLVALSNQKGVDSITVHSIPAEHSYKVVRFKQAFNKLMKAYHESRNAVLREVGIEDEQAFNEKLDCLEKAAGTLSADDALVLADLRAKRAKFNVMLTSLLNEQVVLEGVKTMPYEAWKSLQDENKTDTVDRLAGEILVIRKITADGSMEMEKMDVEFVFEDILWKMPDE